MSSGKVPDPHAFDYIVLRLNLAWPVVSTLLRPWSWCLHIMSFCRVRDCPTALLIQSAIWHREFMRIHETHIPIKISDTTRQQLTAGGCWVILIWIRRSGLLLVRSGVSRWLKSVIPSSWVLGKVLSSHDDNHVVISRGQTAVSPCAKIVLATAKLITWVVFSYKRNPQLQWQGITTRSRARFIFAKGVLVTELVTPAISVCAKSTGCILQKHSSAYGADTD